MGREPRAFEWLPGRSRPTRSNVPTTKILRAENRRRVFDR
jgi:hypothetical protein